LMNSDDLASPGEVVQGYITDACIQSAKLKGYGDAVGVLRGSLFLADEPRSMDDLVAETGYSKSTVSANMSLLERLGFVRRVVRPGDKRHLYLIVNAPDTLRLAMMNTVRKEVELLSRAMDQSERYLMEHEDDDLLKRITMIRAFYEKVSRTIDLMGQYSIDEMVMILERGREILERRSG